LWIELEEILAARSNSFKKLEERKCNVEQVASGWEGSGSISRAGTVSQLKQTPFGLRGSQPNPERSLNRAAVSERIISTRALGRPLKKTRLGAEAY